jgi:hypothetical protein
MFKNQMDGSLGEVGKAFPEDREAIFGKDTADVTHLPSSSFHEAISPLPLPLPLTCPVPTPNHSQPSPPPSQFPFPSHSLSLALFLLPSILSLPLPLPNSHSPSLLTPSQGKWLHKTAPDLKLSEVPLLLLDYHRVAQDNLFLRKQVHRLEQLLQKYGHKEGEELRE